MVYFFPIALTISWQESSHCLQASAQAFISGESNFEHESPQALHASAQAWQEATIKGLCRAIIVAESLQNSAQSAAMCIGRACSFFPSASSLAQWWNIMSHDFAQSEHAS